MSEDEISTYTLFWEAMSGAMAVELVLEEMGLNYRRHPVDMASGEHRTAEYLSLNPTGQVPALKLHDGQVIGESVAIILTLGDRHPGSGLVPEPDDPERPTFLRWLVYMAASPYMTFVQYNHPERFLDDPATHDALEANANARLSGQFDILNAAISGDPYFLRSGPSALDFYLYMLLIFHPDRDALLADRARLRRLFDAVGKRQSARRVTPAHLGQA